MLDHSLVYMHNLFRNAQNEQKRTYLSTRPRDILYRINSAYYQKTE